MLEVIASDYPDVRPATPEATYPYPAIRRLILDRSNINSSPTATWVMNNFRVTDAQTGAAEYSPIRRTRLTPDLYAWVQLQPNPTELVAALNTLLSAIVADDQRRLAPTETQGQG